MYKPLPNGLEIAASITHGMGLFASDKFDAGHNFGTCHIDMEGDLIRTPLGGWINHSEEPNCEKQANAYIIEKEGKNISLGIFSIAERTSFDEIPIDLKSIIKLAF